MVRCSGGIEQESVSCRGKRGVRARIARTAAPSRWQRGPMGPRPSNASTWRVAFGANSACSMRSATMCTESRGQPPASSSWSSDRLSHYRSVKVPPQTGQVTSTRSFNSKRSGMPIACAAALAILTLSFSRMTSPSGRHGGDPWRSIAVAYPQRSGLNVPLAARTREWNRGRHGSRTATRLRVTISRSSPLH